MGSFTMKLLRVSPLFFISFFATVHAVDERVCPLGKSKEKIELTEGDSVTYATQEEESYEANVKCITVFKRVRGETCNLNIICDDVNIERGASFKVDGRKYTTGEVDVLTDNKFLRVIFRTNRKLRAFGSGAVCEVSCIDPSEPTQPSPTSTSTEPSSTGGSTGDCKCGLAQRTTRIVGGQTTEVNEYPWQVGMVYEGSTFVWCGGSLISDQWVLTASHCVQN